MCLTYMLNDYGWVAAWSIEEEYICKHVYKQQGKSMSKFIEW